MGSAASRGVKKLTIGFCSRDCGPMIRAGCVGRVGGRSAEVQPVGAEGSGQFRADQLPHPAARHGARQTRHEPAVRQRVVGRSPLHPAHRGSGHPLLHQDVVHQVGHRRAAQMRQSGAMCHDVADREACLSVRPELGPVLAHRRVVVDQAAIDESMDDGGRHALRGREDHRPGVGIPTPLALAIGPTSPHVHHRHPVEIDG